MQVTRTQEYILLREPLRFNNLPSTLYYFPSMYERHPRHSPQQWRYQIQHFYSQTNCLQLYGMAHLHK